MSKVGPEARSYQAIFPNDLKRLLQIATQDQTAFFKEYPDWGKLYRRRKICIALCQGAALHYVNGATGINDFDVYTFYKNILPETGMPNEINNMISEIRNLDNQWTSLITSVVASIASPEALT